ncbi:ArsR/SmtB family transcription factor [Pseudonocardia lacus]|uniref:ArsR/SmtB family transcription factor n=1 Tax=Pseudonocardia lacus TaxID=2835865 RepID=UPI0027E34DC4|nr:metalloregulator ArsR/SmtB family transcription factor [Pseudonocardia lacus]
MVEQLDAVFHAMADPTRRQMLRALAGSERTVGELAAPHPISLAAASKHVRVLERAGLVRRTVHGRRHVCRLEPAPLAAATEHLRFFERFWEARLDALQAYVAAPEPGTSTDTSTDTDTDTERQTR